MLPWGPPDHSVEAVALESDRAELPGGGSMRLLAAGAGAGPSRRALHVSDSAGPSPRWNGEWDAPVRRWASVEAVPAAPLADHRSMFADPSSSKDRQTTACGSSLRAVR